LLTVALAACGALASAARSVSAVHLGLSSDPSRLFVQWTLTGAGADTQRAEFGASPGSLTSTAAARVWTWADASTGRQYTSAVATLDGLTPGAPFYYRVGSADGWSAVTRSAATRAPADFSAAAPLRVGWLGDLGVVNDQALPYLLNETDLDLFIHVGDCECCSGAFYFLDSDDSTGNAGGKTSLLAASQLGFVDIMRAHGMPLRVLLAPTLHPSFPILFTVDAYDLQDSNGAVGDAFEAMIEPITATTPYMVRALREFSGAMPPCRANAAATSLSCHVPLFPPANDRDAQAITRRDFLRARCPTSLPNAASATRSVPRPPPDAPLRAGRPSVYALHQPVFVHGG
jgi:hypothetical protein